MKKQKPPTVFTDSSTPDTLIESTLRDLVLVELGILALIRAGKLPPATTADELDYDGWMAAGRVGQTVIHTLTDEAIELARESVEHPEGVQEIVDRYAERDRVRSKK